MHSVAPHPPPGSLFSEPMGGVCTYPKRAKKQSASFEMCCSAAGQTIESGDDDHMPVSRGYMRVLYPLLMALVV